MTEPEGPLCVCALPVRGPLDARCAHEPDCPVLDRVPEIFKKADGTIRPTYRNAITRDGLIDIDKVDVERDDLDFDPDDETDYYALSHLDHPEPEPVDPATIDWSDPSGPYFEYGPYNHYLSPLQIALKILKVNKLLAEANELLGKVVLSEEQEPLSLPLTSVDIRQFADHIDTLRKLGWKVAPLPRGRNRKKAPRKTTKRKTS